MTFPEPVEKWLQALESGNYKQTSAALTAVVDNGRKYHCCLGVACELYTQEHPDEVEAVHTPNGFVLYKTQKAQADISLLPEVVSWLGTRDAEGDIDWAQVPKDDPLMPYFRDCDGQHSLAGLNDSGASFADIAAFIRRNPTAVFSRCSP